MLFHNVFQLKNQGDTLTTKGLMIIHLKKFIKKGGLFL